MPFYTPTKNIGEFQLLHNLIIIDLQARSSQGEIWNLYRESKERAKNLDWYVAGLINKGTYIRGLS